MLAACFVLFSPFIHISCQGDSAGHEREKDNKPKSTAEKSDPSKLTLRRAFWSAKAGERSTDDGVVEDPGVEEEV